MILFDSGGTLCIDVDYDMRRATRAIMPYVIKNPRGLGAEELYAALERAFDEIRPARAEGFEVSMWTIMRLACGESGVVLDLDERSFERVFRLALTPVEMTPHIDELLDYLNAAGIRTGVISNSKYTGVSLRERLERLLPRSRFEFYISSCDYALCKPKSALFKIALAQAELPAERVWYCGDSVSNDVRGAHGVGMPAVLYDPRADERTDDVFFDFLKISDWRELIGALKELRL